MATIKGRVRDLDYIQNLNRCQVQMAPRFVGFTRNHCCQMVLEAALILGEKVTVKHDGAKPGRIARVILARKAPTTDPGSGLHYVVEVDVDEADGKCKAKLEGSSKVAVFTRDDRLASLLVTALSAGWKVGYLQYDSGTMEVSRGKLNVEDQ